MRSLAQVEIPAGGAFELLVLARAYRWAAARCRATRSPRRSGRRPGPRIAADLARRGPISSQTGSASCYADARCYNNLKLVSSLASVELLGTGLTAAVADGAARRPRPARPRAAPRRLARARRRSATTCRASGAAPIAGGGVLSDPPRNPLAYHALSTMMLGELNAALGDRAPRGGAARVPACVAARCSRSPRPTATSRGSAAGRARSGCRPSLPTRPRRPRSGPRRPTCAAGTSRSSTRRSRACARTTALAQAACRSSRAPSTGPTLALRRVDPYATTRGYNGLAVDALDRASATLETIDATATRVPSTRARHRAVAGAGRARDHHARPALGGARGEEPRLRRRALRLGGARDAAPRCRRPLGVDHARASVRAADGLGTIAIRVGGRPARAEWRGSRGCWPDRRVDARWLGSAGRRADRRCAERTCSGRSRTTGPSSFASARSPRGRSSPVG